MSTHLNYYFVMKREQRVSRKWYSNHPQSVNTYKCKQKAQAIYSREEGSKDSRMDIVTLSNASTVAMSRKRDMYE